ncbi:MAG: bifunctional aspartate kinase/diaminopimelate decarboxylase [Steroidobacteraceae bacterium]
MPAPINSLSELPWVVLKFGGTSVSSVARWLTIAATLNERRAEGFRVLLVHSALSGVTDRLEHALAASSDEERLRCVAQVQALHEALAQDMGLSAERCRQSLAPWLSQLQQDLGGPAGALHVDDRLRARVMACGELLATAIGAAFLQSREFPVRWLDAREVLKSEQREAASKKAGYLSATCAFDPDQRVQAALRALGPLVITQGFIASDLAGDTVLLGRGGSDTSAAYFAGLLAAAQLEIWTDVPGMFSANPRQLPAARQLLALSYEEAQEIASAGAKVLHPRCLLPARRHGIPLYVYSTVAPTLGGTRIGQGPAGNSAQVKAVCVKRGVTLVTLDSPGMWHEVGFLADAFQIFKQHGLSIDLVSTSETNVTVSLDPMANPMEADTLQRLLRDLEPLCRAAVIGPCASVSLVGRNIRSILHQFGEALALFAEQRIYLVSQAANDLNLTFVVDEAEADSLVEQLHQLLIQTVRDDAVIGRSWAQLFESTADEARNPEPWWLDRREELIALMTGRDAAYVYDRGVVRARCQDLQRLQSVGRISYAMKANAHPQLLRTVVDAGLGIECVSRGEIEQARAAVPGLPAERILFTPNFAPRSEYEWALAQGVHVTLDNLHPLEFWPELFVDRDIFVRLDPGQGRGHHEHVRTGGAQSKFGIAAAELDRLVALAARVGVRVTGLHAHTGSGIVSVDNWIQTAKFLREASRRFPAVRVLDIGGGLAVPDRPGGAGVDLEALDRALRELGFPQAGLELWLEPGRFLVAESGVLLARVTQLKQKGDTAYVGVATGMNSLIRPALYDAYHEIVNLTRLGEQHEYRVEIVGPICETGDVLGHERFLPRSTAERDVLLVGTAGAYGAAMASRYNLRDPAEELVL